MIRTSLFAAAALALSMAAAGAQDGPVIEQVYTLEQLQGMNCGTAHAEGIEVADDIVLQAISYSLAKQNLTMPNTAEAGMAVGKDIVAQCRENPGALLMPVVDRAVAKVATN